MKKSLYGEQKFLDSKNRRKKTWESKDLIDHGRRAVPKTYNPAGQEMQAIYGFLDANNIPQINCKFGSPKEQFWQYIPTVGYRRYDLAVFSDATQQQLKYIMEFHGPGHINFSDFAPELEHEQITVNGKKLAYLGTYGQSYHNDFHKKHHIVDNFPEVVYIVMWVDDLKNRRFKINELY